MSYDLSLVKDGKPVEVEAHEEGGTYVLGGRSEASLNVTYNYSKQFDALDVEKGLRWLYGKTGRETLDRLAHAIAALGTERDNDYWKGTAGNAGHALAVLYRWAKQHPDAVWEGD
jgi:hypothetical protein